jgi:hypothetical protein
MIRLAILLLIVTAAFAQTPKHDDMKDCPMHDETATHHAGVESHGDQAMGFPHDKTTHHFRLTPDGGAIEVTVNEASDKTNISAIRAHLSHIVTMFSEGDFSTPMFVHDGVPPGVTTMKLMKSTIHYQYQEMATGGEVRLQSSDAVAVAAIHDFMRFQITDHRTGDSLEVDGH